MQFIKNNSNNKTYEEYAYKLKKIFDKEFTKFPLKIRWHYADRIYHITGSKKYIPYIKKYCIDRSKEFLGLVKIFNDRNEREKYGRTIVDKIFKKKSSRIRKRYTIYNQIPEFKYLQYLISYFFRFKNYKIEKLLNLEEVSNVLGNLNKIDFAKYFLDEQLMKVDPVQTINTLFHLKHLKIYRSEEVQQIIKYVDKLFKNPTTGAEFTNKLYFYTHVIISETKYYQKFITPEKYSSFYNFFKNKLNDIINIANSDIISEIGVCFKLAKIRNSVVEKLKMEVTNYIEEGKGIIKRDETSKRVSLKSVEHRNVLAIMLLSNWNKLYPGPKINL